MNYLQALTNTQHQTSTPSANEQRLQALVEKITAEYAALKLLLTSTTNNLGPSSVTASSIATNTTSQLTNESLLDSLRSQQEEYQLQQEAKQAHYYAQMEARFERMLHRNIELEEKINNQFLQHAAHAAKSEYSTENDRKNILASDANSQAQQPNPKQYDSKATPTKNHPMRDVDNFQNP